MAQTIEDLDVVLFKTFIDQQYRQPSTIDFNTEDFEFIFVSGYTPSDVHETESDINGIERDRRPATGVSGYRTFNSEVAKCDNIVLIAGEGNTFTDVTHVIFRSITDDRLVAYITVSLDNTVDNQYLTWNPSRTIIDFDIPCALDADTRAGGSVRTGVTTTAVPLPEKINNTDLDTVRPYGKPAAGRFQDTLIWQFQDLPTIEGLLNTAAQDIDTINTDVLAIQKRLDLSIATGDQLDLIGSWIGRTRLKDEEDAEYRYEIYLQTLKNKNEGLLSEVNEIISRSVLRLKDTGIIKVINGFNATVTVETTNPDLLQQYTIDDIEDILPHGVGVGEAIQCHENPFSLEGGEGEGLTSVDVTEQGDGCYRALELDGSTYGYTDNDLGTYNTMSVAIRLNTTSTSGTLLSTRSGDFRLRLDASGFLVTEYNGSSSNSVVAINNDTNQDIVVSYNGVVMTTFINGVQSHSMAVTGSPIGTQVYIGAEFNGTDALQGSYSLLRFWSDSFGAVEVNVLYNAGIGLSHDALSTSYTDDLVVAIELLEDFPVNEEGLDDYGGRLCSLINRDGNNSLLVAFALEDENCETLGLTTIEYLNTDVLAGQLLSL